VIGRHDTENRWHAVDALFLSLSVDDSRIDFSIFRRRECAVAVIKSRLTIVTHFLPSILAGNAGMFSMMKQVICCTW
jgi:hypothetical protein